MNFNKLKILFLLEKAKATKKGNAPIRCRITFGARKILYGIIDKS